MPIERIALGRSSSTATARPTWTASRKRSRYRSRPNGRSRAARSPYETEAMAMTSRAVAAGIDLFDPGLMYEYFAEHLLGDYYRADAIIR